MKSINISIILLSSLLFFSSTSKLIRRSKSQGKMSFKQMINVAKGISRIVRFINQNERLQNVFKQFNSVREEVKKEAIEYYKAEKKKGKKEENIEEYDIGMEAITRTGTRVWNDLLSILADLLDEIPEVIGEILADASGISM